MLESTLSQLRQLKLSSMASALENYSRLQFKLKI